MSHCVLLAALISVAFAGQAGAAAGRVEFAVGAATVVGADGRTRPAERGTELDTGDLVRTNAGRVQMRMTDGAFISLQPDTEFGIKSYKFNGQTDGSENAFYSLLRGAMRTVTGLIGRVNRDRYQIATPTATVGIRGTGGLIQVLEDASTLVQGTSGIWFLANPSGSIDIPAGVAGIAPADPGQPPRETSEVPISGPAPLPPQEEYVQGNERTPDGGLVYEPQTPTGAAPSGGSYGASMFFGHSGAPTFVLATASAATFDASGMTAISNPGSGQNFALGAGGGHFESGSDGIIAWGRWTGSVVGAINATTRFNEVYTADQGFHYVIGVPTASMPRQGGGIYTLLDATAPTYINGTSAPGTLIGQLFVDFGLPLGQVGLDLAVTMPDTSSYAIRGSADIITSTAKFSGNTTAGVSVSGSCASSCGGSVAGFFAGTNAERAGLGYHIADIQNGKDVVGTAAFTK
ncbi:MAG: FecR domain-containing protein [Betaproteobacteria bacterium]|nr:FecR domain-containing protein [Betaproteobacteria bacterium]